eukprot:TRINITY_DN3043_c0_g1_i1.p1 TRINITY_DN3043_c0_g1~~TRINITY_DN3043_c0_g1_i1.p1  ORF type:complete len:159 (-),score=37.09 TRINITY_DN3043_c0_g1_i1:10-486(-)
MDWDSQTRSTENLDSVVNNGRDSSLLLNKSGNATSLVQWGEEIFDQLADVASYMDTAYGTRHYAQTVSRLKTWLNDASLTYSGQYVAQLKAMNVDNGHFALALAKKYKQSHQTMPYHVFSDAYLQQQAEQSIIDEQAITAADNISFKAFLSEYFKGNE